MNVDRYLRNEDDKFYTFMDREVQLEYNSTFHLFQYRRVYCRPCVDN